VCLFLSLSLFFSSTLKSRNFAFETLHLTKSVADRIVAAISKEER
jgi:hypothetical protein